MENDASDLDEDESMNGEQYQDDQNTGERSEDHESSHN